VLGDAYRGKSLLLTGGTGFLGTALVEKMLRSLPELERIYLLIRPSSGKGGRERFEKDILGSDAFDRLREELGEEGLAERAAKVRVLEGDVQARDLGLSREELDELAEGVDVVIHSAASVIFDAPLDAAVDSNVRGTLGLLRLARGWEKRPLFMHISTAYVAGEVEGPVPELLPGGETPNGARIDWREEVAALDRMVQEVEDASWERERASEFEAEARRELGMVGEEPEVAERAEQLRRAWVRERLVERGNERARELGWHDVYTFTKSLAERGVLAERGPLPLVILRPAIIESSLSEPRPGWIQGSRMADPIIMAYAKGVLREFPGNPESVVDLVPVDHVVNAALAAAARRPEEPEVYQVASGERNPLRYRELYGYVREYFLENPLRDAGQRPIPLPEWSFPGRRAVENRLRAELAALKAAGKVAERLPEGHMTQDLRGRIARAEKRARMSFYYSRIYGPYSDIRSTFSAQNTYRLYRELTEEDRREFPFDIAEVDWAEWLQRIHLPAITARPGRKTRRVAKEEEPGQVAAIFDVDGTLVEANVVAYYAWLRMQQLPRPLRPLWLATFLPKIPYYWGLDKISRAHFNRAFYKNYAGWTHEQARQLGRESFHNFTLKRLYPEAMEVLRDHREKGHRIVFLSGALDFVLEPLGGLADDVLCARLSEENGTYTGRLSGAPVAGEARARMLASFARRRNIDLSRSYAYGDSISDLPMLEAVGYPVVVNPDRRLAAEAKRKGWPVRRWRR
jgi:fatty acyl-CoA reductase